MLARGPLAHKDSPRVRAMHICQPLSQAGSSRMLAMLTRGPFTNHSLHSDYPVGLNSVPPFFQLPSSETLAASPVGRSEADPGLIKLTHFTQVGRAIQPPPLEITTTPHVTNHIQICKAESEFFRYSSSHSSKTSPMHLIFVRPVTN
jgi:hypothetical protein